MTRSYSFKEGLAMMAAKEVGVDPYLAAEAGEDARSILAALRRAKTAQGQEKARHIAAAQNELRKLNPKQHGKLINALQAKVLALQGRGGDTAVAHLEPGEMVIPRRVLTPELAQLIAVEAIACGIDPAQLTVGSHKASVNPVTRVEEFGWFQDKLESIGDGVKDALHKVGSIYGVGPLAPSAEIEPITVSATRRNLRLGLSEAGEEIPGTKFSRMIPTETGAEGRMFPDEQAEREKIDLYGPIPHVNRLAKLNIHNMTDPELAKKQQSLGEWGAVKATVAVPVGYIPHRLATVMSQGLGAWAATDEVRANEIQKELDWRKYIRSHR